MIGVSVIRRLLRRLHRDERGFGLIEMTIALTVLAIGVSSVAGLFVTGHLALRRASQSDTAAVLADKLLERFRAETWDTIALNQSLFAGMASDTTYTGDAAYSTDTAITDSTGSCTDTPTPVACNPSRSIPDTTQTPPETAPDGHLYRLDTYVNWGCADAADVLDTSASPPVCRVGSLAGAVDPFSQVKIVTVVVRDATSSTSLAGAPVYRVSSTFDRLSGGFTFGTADPVTGTTSTSTTSTTTAGGGSTAPDPPQTVGLANGGGSGNGYIDIGNTNSLSFDVALGSSSQSTDTITLTVSDGDPTHDQTQTLTGTAGAGIVHFTGINGQVLNDGQITVSAVAQNGNGTSAATTSFATKDTVAPDAPTAVALTNGQGEGSAYVNAAIKSSVSIGVSLDSLSASTDTVSVTLSNGGSSTSAATAPGVAGGGTATVTGVNASSLADGTLTASATVSDAAGNVSAAKTATMPKDTVGPTLANISSANKTGGTALKAEAGDTITLTFGEAVLGSSVPSTSDLSLSTSNGNSPVALTMPGLTSGAFNIDTSNGSGDYLSRGNNTVTFNGSAVSHPTATTVTVTLASPSNASVLQVGPSGGRSITVTPATGLTDKAGNPASSTALTKTTTFF